MIKQIIPVPPGIWLTYSMGGENEPEIGEAVVALALCDDKGCGKLIPIVCDAEEGFFRADEVTNWRGLHIELPRPIQEER